jgi:hypothetical protein
MHVGMSGTKCGAEGRDRNYAVKAIGTAIVEDGRKVPHIRGSATELFDAKAALAKSLTVGSIL